MITRDEAIERAAAILEGVAEKNSMEVKNCFATISIAYSNLAAVLPVETIPKEEASVPVGMQEEPQDRNYVGILIDRIEKFPKSPIYYLSGEGVYYKNTGTLLFSLAMNDFHKQSLAREWLEILTALEGVK